MTDFERLGGQAGVDRILTTFVDRMRGDFIIGFLFEGRDRDRILKHEIELASAHLGGPKGYTGRSLGMVHAPLRILRGQFQRRMAVLKKVLTEHDVPNDIMARWVAHDSALESVVSEPIDCVPPPSRPENR
ncbi:MAG: group 1 truncated hemoglobin [Myxococcota bacterium]